MSSSQAAVSPPSTVATLVLYLGILVVFTIFYVATSQRELSWGDYGTRQLFMLHNNYVGDEALALVHPLYIIMGHAVIQAAPAGYEMWTVNAFSGLGMAIALANLFLLLHRLTGRRWVGVAMAAILGVSHTVWWLSTIAEVYTWSLAGLSLECLLLVALIRRPRWGTLLVLALVNGWGWNIHNFALLTLPVHLTVMAYLMIRKRLPVWSVLPALGAYLVGASLYLYLIFVNAGNMGWSAAISGALVGEYGDDVMGVGSRDYLFINWGLMALNGMSFLPILAVVGWWCFRRRLGGETALALATITLIHVVFVARYTIVDQFTFALPSLWMIALAGGVGLATMVERSGRWRSIAVVGVLVSLVSGPAVYALLPHLVNRTHRDLPHRNDIRYWGTPWKHNEHSADLFVQDVRRQLQPVCDAGKQPIVVVDATPYFPLAVARKLRQLDEALQLQWCGRPLPLMRKASTVRQAAGDNPIYVLASQDLPPTLLQAVTLVKDNPDDVLYRLEWKTDGAE